MFCCESDNDRRIFPVVVGSYDKYATENDGNCYNKRPPYSAKKNSICTLFVLRKKYFGYLTYFPTKVRFFCIKYLIPWMLVLRQNSSKQLFLVFSSRMFSIFKGTVSATSRNIFYNILPTTAKHCVV